jgi:hypothetical protein
VKHTVLALLILCSATLLLAAAPFNTHDDYSNRIVVCFQAGSIVDSDGTIHFNQKDGVVVTGLPSFDALARQYGFTSIEPYFDFVKDKKWTRDGVYLQNIVRVYLKDNSLMDAALSALEKDPNLVYAEFDGIMRPFFTPNDQQFGQQWHLPQIHCPEVWDWEQGSEDIVIGITDTGSKWNHPDLHDNIWINPGESEGMTIDWDNHTISGGNGIDDDGNGKIDDLIGWDFNTQTASSDDDNNPYQNYEPNSHGTHVAGCAGAVGNNEIGVSGSSMNISLMICKGSSDTVPGDGVFNAYSQILYCVDAGADIINCSWGGPNGATTANNTINYAYDHGVLVIVAAGNDNVEHNNSYRSYPSDCENAVCVAATATNDLKADFSDYGAPIDVCAPGVTILSTYVDDTYSALQGTSMASPIVAGVAGIVKSHYPDLTPDELRTRIEDTCENIDEINPDQAGLLGHGRVNVFAATMRDQIPNISIGDIVLTELEGDGDGLCNPGERIALDIQINNAEYWVDAINPTGIVSCSMAGVTVSQPQSTYPTLYNGMTVMNDVHFEFETVSTLASMTVPFTLRLIANEGTTYPFDHSFTFNAPLTLLQANWPIASGGASVSQPVIIDVNNSGAKEAVFGDANNNLHAVEADGTEISGFPVHFGSSISAAVAVGDIDNDQKMEIAVPTLTSGLQLIDDNGAVLHTITVTGQIRSNPIIVDIDANGSLEIIFVEMTGMIHVINADGTDYANFPVNPGSGSIISPCSVADFDADGKKDIIAVTATGNVVVVSGATGSVLSGWPQSITINALKGGTVANLDADAQPEFVVCSNTGRLVAFNHDGSTIFTREIGASVRSGIIVSNIDGTNTPEILFTTQTGYIYAVDAQGNDIANFPLHVGASLEATPILSDLDGDGAQDIVLGDGNGFLHCYTLAGTEVPNFPLEISGTITCSAAIGDVDEDGDSDILFPNSSAYYMVDYKHAARSSHWPCYRGNPARTGSTFDTVGIEDETVPAAPTTALLPNFPNPFNPSTTLAFSLAEPGNVSLCLYNMRGQKINTLLNKTLAAGNHEITWNGTDDHGQSVASGVYMSVFKTGSHVETRKMLMLK